MKKLLSSIAACLAALSVTPAAQATDKISLVALGDSYASGTGAGTYQDGTAGTCWRSQHSYSELIASRLRSEHRLSTFENATCSGAKSTDLAVPFKNQPAQLDALSGETNLVLLTLGANDIGYASYGGLCMQADCTGAPTREILLKMRPMATAVANTLTEVKKRSPHARVVVVGYGRQVSPGDNAALPSLDPICGPGILSSAERESGSQVAAELDAALRAAVREAARKGVNVSFTSPFIIPGALRSSFKDHAMCEAGTPYFRGFDALAPDQEGPEAVLHPNQQGQAALASLVRV